MYIYIGALVVGIFFLCCTSFAFAGIARRYYVKLIFNVLHKLLNNFCPFHALKGGQRNSLNSLNSQQSAVSSQKSIANAARGYTSSSSSVEELYETARRLKEKFM